MVQTVLTVKNGADGKDGTNGTNGADGKDGIGITETTVNSVGELVIKYSDGTSTNLGYSCRN